MRHDLDTDVSGGTAARQRMQERGAEGWRLVTACRYVVGEAVFYDLFWQQEDARPSGHTFTQGVCLHCEAGEGSAAHAASPDRCPALAEAAT